MLAVPLVIVLVSALAVALASPVAVVLAPVQVASTEFPCRGHRGVHSTSTGTTHYGMNSGMLISLPAGT